MYAIQNTKLTRNLPAKKLVVKDGLFRKSLTSMFVQNVQHSNEKMKTTNSTIGCLFGTQ